MLTIILSAALLFILWQLASWRVFRVASQRIEKAVLATSQTITSAFLATTPIRRPNRCPRHRTDLDRLEREETEIAFHEALFYAEQLLGRWHCLLIRFALLRWNLNGWLEAEIESTVYRLKAHRVLPVSQKTLTTHNPAFRWFSKLVDQVIRLYGSRMFRSGPIGYDGPDLGPDFGPAGISPFDRTAPAPAAPSHR